MELTQHQIRISNASVTLNKSSSIAHSSKLPRLSGEQLNLKLNLMVNLKELLNIQVKLEELVKNKMKKTSKAQLQLVLKMRKLRKILLQPRPVPSKLLKNHTDSEKLRLRRRK
jgi:hypothetical protein